MFMLQYKYITEGSYVALGYTGKSVSYLSTPPSKSHMMVCRKGIAPAEGRAFAL